MYIMHGMRVIKFSTVSKGRHRLASEPLLGRNFQVVGRSDATYHTMHAKKASAGPDTEVQGLENSQGASSQFHTKFVAIFWNI